MIVEIDIKVDEIEDLNAAIQERKTQKPSLTNRDPMGAPVLPPPVSITLFFSRWCWCRYHTTIIHFCHFIKSKILISYFSSNCYLFMSC